MNSSSSLPRFLAVGLLGGSALLGPLSALRLLPAAPAGPGPAPVRPVQPICSPAGPTVVEMAPTRRAGRARAAYALRFPATAFGVAVSGAGHYVYDVEVTAEGLTGGGPSGRVYLAWVATPQLDEWIKLGPVADDQPATGEVAWNRFIVFVTAEEAADARAWSQEFYFSALSPSSRMHTMVGHGPFASEPCLDPRN
jgi:hypothetical protein